MPARRSAIGLVGSRAYDDGASGALDDRQELSSLLRRHVELVERVVEVVDEGLPLVVRDQQVATRSQGPDAKRRPPAPVAGSGWSTQAGTEPVLDGPDPVGLVRAAHDLAVHSGGAGAADVQGDVV